MTLRGPSIAIVGAGATGLSTAVAAARLGARKVTVVDRDYVASGSSALSAGVIDTQFTTSAEIELRTKSFEVFEELERDRDLPIVRNGFIRTARNELELALFEAALPLQHELGVADARVLDQQELAALVPDMVVDGLAGGLYGPTNGYVDGHLLCTTYAEQAEELGVELRVRTTVQGLEVKGGVAHLLTSAGPIECDVVVNAAGAWAPEVGQALGAPVAVLPQRHQVCIGHLAEPLPYLMPTVMDHVPGRGDAGLYFRHDGEGKLLIGFHSADVLDEPEDPDRFSRAVDADFYETLAEVLLERLPRLADMGLGDGWAGLYPNSPDGKPTVGPHRDEPRVISACGVGGYGIMISPAVGLLAAEWACRDAATAVAGADAYLPDRHQAAAA
jgi:glycine/D-amino acid oxidase-like deaminating enzyme